MNPVLEIVFQHPVRISTMPEIRKFGNAADEIFVHKLKTGHPTPEESDYLFLNLLHVFSAM